MTTDFPVEPLADTAIRVSPVVHLREDHAFVDPGQLYSTTVTVRNVSAIVESYDVTPIGPASPWVDVTPSVLSLFPGEEGQATISFRPPTSSTVVAGDYVVGIRAMSQVSRECTSAAELLVSVAPFYRFGTDIARTTFAVRTRANSQIRVINTGNSTVEFAIEAFDPEGYMKVLLEFSQLTLAPGESAWIPIKTRMAPRIFGASNDTRTVEITVTPVRNVDIDLLILETPPSELRMNILHKPFIRLRLGLFGRLVFLFAIIALITAFVLSRWLDNTPPPVTGAPPVPTNFSAMVNDLNQPVLTWEQSPGASQYTIYAVGAAGDPVPSPTPTINVQVPSAATPVFAAGSAMFRSAALVTEGGDALTTTSSATPTPSPSVTGEIPFTGDEATDFPDLVPSDSAEPLTADDLLPSPVCQGCTEIATVDAGTTRFVVEKVNPGEACYRIAAKVGETQSLYSPESCVEIIDPNWVDPETGLDANGNVPSAAGGAGGADAAPAAIPPCPPIKTDARAVSPTSVAVLWKPATNPPKGWVAPDPNATPTPAASDDPSAETVKVCDPAKTLTGWSVQRKIFTGWSDVSPEPKAPDSAVEVTGLNPDTKYCFRMRANAADASSKYTKKFCVRTLPGIDPAPESSTAVDPSPSPSASAL